MRVLMCVRDGRADKVSRPRLGGEGRRAVGDIGFAPGAPENVGAALVGEKVVLISSALRLLACSALSKSNCMLNL